MDEELHVPQPRKRSHWLKLTLELIAVFVGITAGFFFENFREERANRIQEKKFLSSQVSEEFDPNSREFHNVSSAFYLMVNPRWK